MSPTAATRLYAVLGRPVGHSLSPALHNAWFGHHGVDAVYVALDVPPERAAELPLALDVLGLAGANLTVPLKGAIVGALASADPAVQALGAANTIVRGPAGWEGYNTDAEGFARGFEGRFGRTLAGRRAVILGAGGAAAAVACALLGRGAGPITLLNRGRDRAEALAARLRAIAPHAAIAVDALDSTTFSRLAAGAELVVNALTGPAADAVRTLDPAVLAPDAVWCDLNYWMADPPQQAACAARGLAFQGGLPMLIHQAALAFIRFTGIEPDLDAGLRALPVHLRRALG